MRLKIGNKIFEIAVHDDPNHPRKQGDGRCGEEGHLFRRIDGKQMHSCYWCGTDIDNT